MVSDLHAMFIEHDEDFLLLAGENDAVACYWSILSCSHLLLVNPKMQSPAIGQSQDAVACYIMVSYYTVYDADFRLIS